MYLRVGINSSSSPLLTISRRWKTTYPNYITNTPITKVSTLPSGLRVATGTGGGDIATVGLWFNTGSAREAETNFGINNFLHKLILSGGNLEKEIEGLGANLTGYSDRETTSFYGQTHKNDVEKFVTILGAAFQNNSINSAELETVREKIINVHRSKINNWNADTLLDHVHAAAYQGTGHAAATIGDPDIVKQITADSLIHWKQHNFSQNNLVLVGTGAVNHALLEQLASRAFSQLPNHIIQPFGRVDFIGSEIRIRDDTSHTCKLAFAWEAVGRSDAHFWTFLLLQTIVGQWKKDSISGGFASSRWAEQVALYKLASSYQSTYKAYNNTGLFEVYMETLPETQDDATYMIFNEFQKLATYITPEELFRAKNNLKRALLSQFENSKNLAEALGESVLATNRAISPAEYFQRIDEIDTKDIDNILGTFFTDVDPVAVAHGPIEDFPDYYLLRNWTYWNRW